MGCNVYKACLTCKKIYYCGHESFSRAGELASRFPDSEHEGHPLADLWIDDHTWEYYVGRDNRGKVFLRDYADFEHINFEE